MRRYVWNKSYLLGFGYGFVGTSKQITPSRWKSCNVSASSDDARRADVLLCVPRGHAQNDVSTCAHICTPHVVRAHAQKKDTRSFTGV